MITPAPIADLDLNDQHQRDTYQERVRQQYVDNREQAIADAKALTGRDFDDWISAFLAIVEHRITEVRRVEPPMGKFRKVREGWYTIAIVSFDDVMQEIRDRVPAGERRYEEHVDVSRAKHGDGWIVSTRGGREHQDRVNQLDQGSLFSTSLSSFAEAKRYAVALKAYLTNMGPHPDWLLPVFSREAQQAHEAHIEKMVGKPYAEYMAEVMGRVR